MRFIDWLRNPILDDQAIKHLETLQEARIGFINSRVYDEDDNIREREDAINSLSSDGTREALFGEFLPELFDRLFSDGWKGIFNKTLEGHFGKNYKSQNKDRESEAGAGAETESNEDALSKELSRANKELVGAAKELALAILAVLRSNLTLKQYMKIVNVSKPMFGAQNKSGRLGQPKSRSKASSTPRTNHTPLRGFVGLDVNLSSVNLYLGFGRLQSLFEFPMDRKSRMAFYSDSKQENKERKSNSDHHQFKVFPASACFIPGNEVVGGCIGFKRHRSSEIYSLLLNIRAILRQHEDIIRLGKAQRLGFYLEQEKNLITWSKWPILLDLRINHFRFYKALKNFAVNLSFRIAGLEDYIKGKITEINEHWPLPSLTTLWDAVRKNKYFPDEIKKTWRKEFRGVSKIDPFNFDQEVKLLEDLKLYLRPVGAENNAYSTTQDCNSEINDDYDNEMITGNDMNFDNAQQSNSEQYDREEALDLSMPKNLTMNQDYLDEEEILDLSSRRPEKRFAYDNSDDFLPARRRN